MTTSSQSTIVEVYAQNLLSSAAQAAKPEELLSLSEATQAAVSALNASRDLRETLRDTKIPLSARVSVVDEIFGGFPPALLSTLHLMIERDELKLLRRVEERLVFLLEEKFRLTVIDVTSAVALDDGLRKKIVDKYSAQFGTTVLLQEHVDPEIMGGIVMQTHGKRIDASLTFQLSRARAVLAGGTIGGAT
ncbi:MAG: ATP synthase F1 subunit delta [Actinomycetia bacterium]|nr:ATP synthase F1 subunit delta [Actinomycetes bacterium]